MAGIFDGLGVHTIDNYKKGASNEVVENNPFLSLLFNKGRIERKQAGTALVGDIEAGLFTPRISSDGDDRSGQFTNQVHDKRWTSQWAQVSVETGVSFGELRRNWGEQALVSMADVKVPRMFKAIMTNGPTSLNGQILSNNSTAYTAAGSPGLPIDGLPTLLPGASTQHTVAQAITAYDLEGYNPVTNAVTGLAPAVTDLEVAVGNAPVLTANYCGLPIKPGALTAVDGVKADAWSGTCVNSGATTFGGNILNFSQYTASRAARFALNDETYRPNFGVTNFTQYLALGNALGNKQTIFVQPGAESNTKFGTGFKLDNMLFHAGLWWYFDQSCPAGRGFVVNVDQSMYYAQPIIDTVDAQSIPQGFETGGGKVKTWEMIESHIHFDINRLALNCAALINGQMMFFPRYQGAWDAYT